MRHRRPDFTRAARCLTRGHGPRPRHPHRADGDICDHARYRKSHLRRGNTTHAATDRRLGAPGRRFNDCRERVHIARFCMLGAKGAKTFTALAAQTA
jgi:hypothetical protein